MKKSLNINYQIIYLFINNFLILFINEFKQFSQITYY